MSTTISPAFKIADDFDVFRFAEIARAELTAEIVRLYHTQVLHYAVMNKDSHPDQDFRDVVVSELKEDFNRDLHFRATFLFYRNHVRNEVYVRPLGFVSEVANKLNKLPYIDSDFSYWDGSDSQLESMSEEEWKDRKKAWMETIPYDGKSLHHVEVKLFDDYMVHVASSLKSFVESYPSLVYPSIDKRRHDLLFDAYHRKLTDSGVPLSGEDVMKAVSQYSYMRTPDAFLQVEEHPELLAAAVFETDEYLQENPFYPLS